MVLTVMSFWRLWPSSYLQIGWHETRAASWGKLICSKLCPAVLWYCVFITYLGPGFVCFGFGCIRAAALKEVGRFHGADFFGNGDNEKLAHGGVVCGGNAPGGAFKGLWKAKGVAAHGLGSFIAGLRSLKRLKTCSGLKTEIPKLATGVGGVSGTLVVVAQAHLVPQLHRRTPEFSNFG